MRKHQFFALFRSNANDKEPSKDRFDDRIYRDRGKRCYCGDNRENEYHDSKNTARCFLDADESEDTREKGKNSDNGRDECADVKREDRLYSGNGGIDAPDYIDDAYDYSEQGLSSFFHCLSSEHSLYFYYK